MKLRKLLYGIAAISMIAPVAFESVGQPTAQASEAGKAVSKKEAIDYAYRIQKTFNKSYGPTTSKKLFEKQVIYAAKKGSHTEVDTPFSITKFYVTRKGNSIHVNVVFSPDGKKPSEKNYKANNVKHNYIFHV
ncbi:hypothetical protein ACYATM_01245 [Lactobacillaceae bacterium Scapto_B20]